ncbi:hypothetical protein HPP92_022989 [Vanilla planifolia]|uniref:Uncharacterized protein n=1 Tax=Vanilla planifolia TaxID=51239 RepID=A0A835PUL4_VANPL|nr:hypothetical protein HPP92_022989 [Vanilla planifolia]
MGQHESALVCGSTWRERGAKDGRRQTLIAIGSRDRDQELLIPVMDGPSDETPIQALIELFYTFILIKVVDNKKRLNHVIKHEFHVQIKNFEIHEDREGDKRNVTRRVKSRHFTKLFMVGPQKVHDRMSYQVIALAQRQNIKSHTQGLPLRLHNQGMP